MLHRHFKQANTSGLLSWFESGSPLEGDLATNPSLGIMLSDAQQYLSRTAWPGIFPGVMLLLICLGFNLFGDALRDALDPKTKR